jgi:HEAT repeat protein
VAPAAPECAPLLVELLGAEEEMIRWTAVETLAEMGKGAVSALAGALDAEQMEVRLYAVKALGKSKAPAELVIPLLVSALADSYWGVRQDAVMWLGRFGPAAQPAIPALLEAFTDKDTRVPHAAGDAVLDIDPTALGQALSHPKAAVRAYACYWPANWGPQGVVFVPQMLKLLKEDPDAQVRYRAARGLEHFPSKAAQIVPGLIAALEDENGHVRAGVCIALRQFGPEAVVAVPALIDTHRRHAKPFYRQNPFQKIVHVPSIQTDTGRPATALRKLAPYAVPGMVKNLASGDPAKQRRAAELLSVLGEPATPAVPLLTRLLPEADEVTRRNILDALINLGPVASPALGELMKLLEHQDPEVRVRVLMALRAIGSGARQAVPKTILLLDDKSNSVRCHALVTLAKVADPDVSVGHLAAALTHRGRFHITARQAVVPTLHLHLDHTAEHVPKLAQALSDGDSAFVSSIIQILGDLGPRATEAVPALRQVAAKPDHPSLSNAAKEALARVEASK